MALPQPVHQPVHQPVQPDADLRYDLRLVETPDDLKHCVRWLREQEHLLLDSEATGKNPRSATPLLLQLGSEDTAWVINLTCFSDFQLVPLFNALSRVRLIIGHNLNYDYKLLRAHYPAVTFRAVYDTQIVEQLLTSGMFENKGLWMKGTALKVLAQRYLGRELDKEVRETFIDADPDDFHPTLEQCRYGADDVMVLPSIMDAQMARLEDEGMLDAARLRCRAVLPLAEVELRGMLIDQAAWREFIAGMEVERDQVKAELEELLTAHELRYRQQKYFEATQERTLWEETYARVQSAVRADWEANHQDEPWGKFKNAELARWREVHPRPPLPHLDLSNINLNSNQQVLRALQAMGLEIESTDKLTRQAAERSGKLTAEQQRVLAVYAQYNKLQKYISAFGENILERIDPETGRLHPTYNIGLTDTGRMSAENPNFQNFPRVNAIRHAFLADPGTVVITADFKGQELAISAALSGDALMKQDIIEGKDLYRLLAVDLFGISLDEVTAEQRQMCKSALLGISYGLSAVGMERNHGIDRALGEKILAQIRKRYKTMVDWSDQQANLALTRGYVTTASGARRYFTRKDLPRWKIENQGRNAPVQGTGAEIVYRTTYRLEKHLAPKGIVPVNYVHDEAVVLAPEVIAEEAAKLVKREMQQAFLDVLPFDRFGMRIDVDVHIDRYWTK